MAQTVTRAFDEFLKDPVNLDPADTNLARRSRDWLFDRIEAFPASIPDFPLLYGGKSMPYGSFSRRTKIRPLDDIDMLSCLAATGATYTVNSHDDVRITPPNSSRLYALTWNDSDELNSRRVINRYVSALETVGQYRVAEINRSGEAATLQLNSYEWNFDVVPAFHTSPESDGRSYYLIPNGNGHWKKTDPRIDRDRVIRVNSQHSGNMLNVLRCVKYWQKRPTMVTMPSYLLECMIVDYFESVTHQVSHYVDLELAAAFRAVGRAVIGRVPDPKEIEYDINTLGWQDRVAIQARALSDANKADEARALEDSNNQRGSINKWREIFGDEFPQFGAP